jgi:hypothetical protein
MDNKVGNRKYIGAPSRCKRKSNCGFDAAKAFLRSFLSSNVKQRLSIGTPLAAASPAEILDLLIGGSLIELDNGWRLTTARIAGDYVLELVLNGVPANRNELLGYGLLEEIIHYKRRWFVVKDDALDMHVRLLPQRKPIKDLTIDGESPEVTTEFE